ncbi:hypothetical protein EVAR_77104_1 [Eumeta japonica]|uniref:Uncharacterized protein n=1 Tax=Eumeta variegata TaxID=151549 RepID=A0A4C1T4K9_EUMVA|nr:hypothetical protein EVAR_77104_1 [Eumeta japonica]
MTHCRVPLVPSVRARARNKRSLFHSIGRCVRVEEKQRPHTTYTFKFQALQPGIKRASQSTHLSSGVNKTLHIVASGTRRKQGVGGANDRRYVRRLITIGNPPDRSPPIAHAGCAGAPEIIPAEYHPPTAA